MGKDRLPTRLADECSPNGAKKFRLAEPRKLEAPRNLQVGIESLNFEEPKWTTYEERVPDMTDIFEKSSVFFASERRFIDSTPESMRHTPRLPASIGHSAL